MAILVDNCKAYKTRTNGNHDLVFWSDNTSGDQGNWDIIFLQNGYDNSSVSTSDGVVNYSHSCAHSNWNYNSRSYTITMDNSLRTAIQSKINSGGLVNLQNYIGNINELKGYDLNGNNTCSVFGYICKSSAKTGSFEVVQKSRFTGSWPSNFIQSIVYTYSIPNVGTISDTVTLLSEGWYTRGSSRHFWLVGSELAYHHTEDEIFNSSNSWSNGKPFTGPESSVQINCTLGYYTINGIYSRNTGSRYSYNDNAADVILNAGSSYFGGLNKSVLVNLLNAPNKTTYTITPFSITNQIILAITDVNFQNNTITVKFAMHHDRDHSMCAFLTSNEYNVTALRVIYNYPVTTVHNIVDSWQLQFINKSDYNPTEANGSGASAVIWDTSTHSVQLTAGASVNNSNGFSKIITRTQGTIQCSCVNTGTVRFTMGGYTITIPSNVTQFDVRILAINNGVTGFWRINVPSSGTSHSFQLTYPATENASIVTFQNELYTAIVQAIDNPGLPMIFQIENINDEYTITVSGVVRCDKIVKDSKTYLSISIYDVNGDFSSLLVKNGMYVTAPVTLTADIQIVNNTILVKAGMASIGYTNTSVGDITYNTDAIAVLLPAVASISKSGSRIGYTTTTVNQNSFAFSFSALKNEVDQTDDFVSHYLQ